MLQRAWQRRDHPVSWLLLPLSWLYGGLRRLIAAQRSLPSPTPVPVIVVGNVTVGGVGKTPVVVWLVERLRARGLRVGVVSRGYGRSSQGLHVAVDPPDPTVLGDEPAMLRDRLRVPVAVAERRMDAVTALAPGVDVIVSDDGLQHTAMARAAEIAVVDGQRGLGNGWLLPAGPLREPATRLRSVDVVLVRDPTPAIGEQLSALGVHAVNLTVEAGSIRRVDGSGEGGTTLEDWRGREVHAVAGIGFPERFFATLRAAGVQPIVHAFADHHAFTPADLDFGDTLPVLMTAKDAIKCAAFAAPHWHCLDVHAKLSASALAAMDALLDRVVGPPVKSH